MIEFFDRKGQPAAFCHDGRSIYLWDGRAVAILEDDAVFGYGGRHIGWLDDGWIRDAEGKCLLYEADAIRGPAKPQRGARTFPGARGLRPARGELQAVPARPARSEIWSDRTFLDLI